MEKKNKTERRKKKKKTVSYNDQNRFITAESGWIPGG